jgi:Protein of unknown function (DUF2652)/Polyketide cyclase / dehydrase and lipid transport
MIGDSEPACLAIADISGYTEYLAGVELDHAQDILADLVTTVVTALRPTFHLAKLEGDAAFVYALTPDVDGSILLDTLERCYFAFRQRLFSIRQASTCNCDACERIPGLELKVVVHHGTVVVHEVAGISELVGSDVIVVHRLLKNSIDSSAYAFVTDACVAVAGFDPTALGMERHTETYDHIGEIGGWVHRLEPAWQAYQDRSRVYIGEDEAVLDYATFVPARPELVWEFISSPTLRAEWGAGLDRIDQLDPSGRRRPGTLNHCVHGAAVILQEFIDWRPPRYFTSRATVPGGLVVVSTHEVEPVEGGAIVHDRFQQPDEEAMAPMMHGLKEMLDHGYEMEAEALRAAVARALASAATIAEPVLPGFDEARRHASAVPATNR